ncbi:MAG: bifunctional (p)ppGpp synthetase/guanosine-3',5'-bis(diphosphate) 3'-pyrophosphohydrolase [Pseudomonadota bacterium]
MVRQYELVERVQAYLPDADEDLLNKAYIYAMQKHGTQTRADGAPYITHPLEVANILTEMHLDEATIATALLHDTIEDTDATRTEIDERFGSEIGSLVEGLTKVDSINFESKQVAQAENLRRLLLAVADDIRVLLVKLADRLHNMRTLDVMRPDKRKRISQETMDVYAPLAGRMGMQDMRDELEDLAFQYLHGDRHEALVHRLGELTDEHKNVVESARLALIEEFEKSGINAEVLGRQKRPYSIFRKMERKGLSLEQLSDLYGFRVITESVAECYQAMGAAHTRWQMVPGRFKDYISIPKQNGYRSLHTTIVGPAKRRVELQIRTQQMHAVAEYGVASHAKYKEGDGASKPPVSPTDRAYGWLRRTIDMLDGGDNPEEFLENTKLELFLDQVFCFTPKGMLIALPKGATAIDFAYAVHTRVGDECVGARVNGNPVPVTQHLRNGDEVQILTGQRTKNALSWETAAVTGKARAALRKQARTDDGRRNRIIGQSLLRHALARRGRTFDIEALEPLLEVFNIKSVDDLVSQVGEGKLAARKVLTALDVPEEALGNGAASSHGNQIADGGSVRLRNSVKARTYGVLQEQLPLQFAPVCGALPGDRIIGILEPGVGITVYPSDAPALAQFEDNEFWIDMQWDVPDGDATVFPASITVDASDVPGALARIAETLADHNGNIVDLSLMSLTSAGKGGAHGDVQSVRMTINLEIATLKALNSAMNDLRGNPLVRQVSRRME